MSWRGRSRESARRVTLSTEFEQAAELGRFQAGRSESPWAGRLRTRSTAGQAQGPTEKAAARERGSRSLLTRSVRPKVEGRNIEIKKEGKDKQKLRQVDERQARRMRRGAAKADTKRGEGRVSHRRKQADDLRPDVALVQVTKQNPTARISRADTQTPVTARRAGRSIEIEEKVEFVQEPRGLEDLDDEIPDMAEGELGPYAVVEEDLNGGWDGQGERGKEGGNGRRASSAVRYGQKPEMSPKTPNASRGGQQTDNLKDNGEKLKEGGEVGPRNGNKEDTGVRSPETVVKQPVAGRSIVGSPGSKAADAAAGMVSPSSLRALKATFEMGVQAELQARRAETARQIEEDKERMMAHEAALRKRMREKEEAEAARDLAVREAEEYAASKKRAAEESERRAKRARSEAEEAEAERETKRQRAEEDFRERVKTLGVEEERRAVEKLREAIQEREKALEEGEKKEADAVGALVNEQLEELQRKVNRIWDQQLGSPNGA